LNPDRAQHAQYALCIADNCVQEVYEIDQWYPAGTTPYYTRTITQAECAGRLEFTGKVAPDGIRKKYYKKSTEGFFKQGAAYPINYVNS